MLGFFFRVSGEGIEFTRLDGANEIETCAFFAWEEGEARRRGRRSSGVGSDGLDVLRVQV